MQWPFRWMVLKVELMIDPIDHLGGSAQWNLQKLEVYIFVQFPQRLESLLCDLAMGVMMSLPPLFFFIHMESFLHQLLFCLITTCLLRYDSSGLAAFAFCRHTSWSLLCWLLLMTCSKPSSVSQKGAFPRLDNHPKDVLLLSMWIRTIFMKRAAAVRGAGEEKTGLIRLKK